MPGEALEVELVVDADAVRSLRLRSDRLVHAARVFSGKSAEEASRLVPLLFALCGRAQSEAAHRAFDQMASRTPSRAEVAARALLVEAEAIDQHLQAILLAWPQVDGGSPQMGVYLPLRRHLSQLESLLGPGGFALRSLRRQLEPSPDLMAWAQELRQSVAPWSALDGHSAEKLKSDLEPVLASSGRAVQLARATDLLRAVQDAHHPDFAAHPTLDDRRPAEVGPLARWVDDPRLVDRVATHGPAILTRCLARLLDVDARLDAIDEALPELSAEDLDVGYLEDLDGEAVAQVNTSRGPLHHVISMDKGRVVSWQVVAPTEWNFHPKGTLAELVGVERSRAERTGRWLLTSLDPCVPHTLSIVEGLPEKT
ncbi:MAG: nickel-dependent hydrogenase large subunit [Myxococcota bacterium]